MNLGEMQSELVLLADNMPSSDPFYLLIYPTTGNERTNVLFRAANRLIRMAVGPNRQNADAFPELKNTWTAGPTVSGNNAIARPSDCIAVQRVTSAHSATLPNWSTTREYSVNFIDRYHFGLLTKDTAVDSRADYPTIYTLLGKLVMIHPTPDPLHIDYLRFYGIAEETPLSDPSDSFALDEYWHPLIIKLAASDLAGKMGWKDESATWYTEVRDEIQNTMNVGAEEVSGGSADLADVMPSTTVSGLYW